jgi:hypothetical protein
MARRLSGQRTRLQQALQDVTIPDEPPAGYPHMSRYVNAWAWLRRHINDGETLTSISDDCGIIRSAIYMRMSVAAEKAGLIELTDDFAKSRYVYPKSG